MNSFQLSVKCGLGAEASFPVIYLNGMGNN